MALSDPDREDALQQHFSCALQNPDTMSASASQSRMKQAREVGDDCLALALDAAETINARNSPERMAAHQMAALHSMAMKVMAKRSDLIDGKGDAYLRADTVEGSRMLNTAARLISVYQNGLATMAKVRSGGRQEVTVQHVNVSDGGQAVVAGQLGGGEDKKGGKKRNG